MARQDACAWLVWSYCSCWLRIPLVFRDVISIVAHPLSKSSHVLLLLFFLGSQVPLLAGEPTTPTQFWPRNSDRLERWAWVRGRRKQWQRKGTLRGLVDLARGGRRWLAAPSHCLTTCPLKNHGQSARNKNSAMDLLDANAWSHKNPCYNISTLYFQYYFFAINTFST